MLKITGIKGLFQCLAMGALGLSLAACDDVTTWNQADSSSSSSSSSSSVSTYAYSGTVSGNTGTLTLYNNSAYICEIPYTASGSATSTTGKLCSATSTTPTTAGTFTLNLPKGLAYSVTFVGAQGQVCTAPSTTTAAATGTVQAGTLSAAVSGVAISCVSSLNLKGTVSGLGTGKTLVLKNNVGTLATKSVTANTSTSPAGTTDTFFAATSGAYAVIVDTQPVGQTCTVVGGTGTQSTADVTSIAVTCVTNSYAVGGTASGLATGAVVGLSLNGGSTVNVTANGSFTVGSIISGSSYIVNIMTQPSQQSSPVDQTCLVTNPTGTVVGSAITTVGVACATNTYNVSGAVSGLGASKSVALSITGTNGTATATASANGVFTFSPKLPNGTYAVSVSTQPVGQTCSVTSGGVTVSSADNSSVVLNCVTNGYTIGGVVNGLPVGSTLKLQNNGADEITVIGSGTGVTSIPFTFPATVLSSATFAVTVSSQPASPLQCNVTAPVGGSGTVAGSNITSVVVTCSNSSFTINGTVVGLSGSVTLSNGASSVTRITNGPFSFTYMPGGTAYTVTVTSQPASSYCTLSGSGVSGTLNADVAAADLIVTCNNGLVSGTISGLTNNGLKLTLNGSGELIKNTGETSFAFSAPVANAATYTVAISAQPAGLTCTLTNPSGTITAGNVTNVGVLCAPTTYTIGGTVTNLAAGKTVTLVNGTDPTQVTPTAANGSFTFVTPKLPGDAYTVTVATGGQPAGYTCVVTNGTGLVDATTPVNVTTIAVDCVTVAGYSIGGTMTGVPVGIGQAAYMKLNLAIDGVSAGDFPVVYGSGNPVTGTGTFTFGTPALWTSTLSVSNNSLVVNASKLYLVNFGGSVACTLVTAPVGTVIGTPETIANTVTGTVCAQNITMTYVGPYTGATASTYAPLTFATGKAYAVTVATQPSHGTCAVTNGSGTLSNVNITAYNATTNPTGILVNCSYSESLISGVVTGYNLPTASAILTITGTDVSNAAQTEDTAAITTTGAGSFAFTSTKYYKAGTAYTVTVKTQPTYAASPKSCVILNGAGTVPSGTDSVLNVNNLILACYTNDMLNAAAYVATSGAANGGIVPFTFSSAGVPSAQPVVTSTLTAPTQVLVNPYNNVVGYVVDSDGAVNNVRILTFTNKSAPIVAGTGTAVPGAYGIAINPTNGMTAVVTSTTGNKVYVYAASQTAGTLTLSTSTALSSGTATVGTTPRGIAYHPSGKYIYVVNSGSNTVGAYTSAGNPPTFAALNTLNLTTNTVATGSTPYNIAFDASGKYAYVTNSGDGSVSQYKVCQLTTATCTAGTLSPLTPASVTVEASNVAVQKIVADQTSVYVLAASGKVYQFTIGSNGALTAKTTTFVDSGAGTVGLALGATWSNLYTINSTQLLYNTLSGSPSALGGSFTGVSTTQTGGIAIDVFR